MKKLCLTSKTRKSNCFWRDIIFIGAIVLIFAYPSLTANAQTRIEPIPTENTFTSEDGFPGKVQIFWVALDGTIWFASRTGITRYDGTTWETYNDLWNADPHAIWGDEIGNVYVLYLYEERYDARGDFYEMPSIIFHFSNETNQWNQIPFDELDEFLWEFYEPPVVWVDHFNSIWLGTLDGQLFFYNGISLEELKFQVVPSPEVILARFSSNIWSNSLRFWLNSSAAFSS